MCFAVDERPKNWQSGGCAVLGDWTSRNTKERDLLHFLVPDHQLRWVVGLLTKRFWPLVSFSATFSLLEAAILSPIVGGLVRRGLDNWGRGPVGNFEVAEFLLSPTGITGLILFGAVQLSTLNLRLAGLLAVLGGNGPGAWYAFQTLRFFPTLLSIGLRQVVVYGLLAVPFLIAGWIAYAILWAPHDLYRLVVSRPPEFWYGVVVVLGLIGGYAILASRWFLRWLFVVPAVVFEPEAHSNALAALRSSTERTKEQIRSLAALVALGAGLAIGGFSILAWVLATVSGLILDQAGESFSVVVTVTAFVLAADVVILAVLSAMAVALFTGVILARYRSLGGPTTTPIPSDRRTLFWSRVGVVACSIFAFLGIGAGWKLVIDSRVSETLEITAHRAGSKEAPENSLAAIRRAIEIGADWAEIDVQLTADGQVVVIHDTDLIRVAGSPLRVAESTLKELQEVDIGTPFRPEFAGERVPTLDDCLLVAGNDIRLNIEMKPKDRADVIPLTEGVISAIRRASKGTPEVANSRSRVCSQSLPAIRLAKQMEPTIEIGFIAATSVGDLTRLDVDFLMVETRLATRKLLERAQLHGMPIHVWTVNDPALLAPLIDLGVSNIITSDPSRMLARLDELRELDPVERLLLRVRNEWTSNR